MVKSSQTIKALYQLLIVCPYWFNSISLCDLGYLLNCLPLHLSIGPCIDPGCVDVGMPKELREEDKRHPGTIQMHGTGMPKLVWMYSFRHFRTSPPCHFTIFFHKEINGIGGHSAFATMMRCKEKIVITLPLLGRMCFIQISFEQFNHRGGDWNYSQFISLSSTLTWIDADNNIQFTLMAALNENDILHIAESVSLVKTEK